MIYDYTLKDETQQMILARLRSTEWLLSKVATKLSKVAREANIYAMPDLGISHNVTRMLGGFFTGALYQWDTTVPFIPVDSTVNVCGTAVYQIKMEFSISEFQKRLFSVLSDCSRYSWNFDRGNHFVSLCHSNGKYHLERGYYLVVHASACEYKERLYPVKGNWYDDKIQTEYLPENHAYLRYLAGTDAENFYKLAYELVDFNATRNYEFCKQVLGKHLGKEILNVAHYGMPDINSVAIGCHWKPDINTLLTAPGEPILLIKPQVPYTPHGFGLHIPNEGVLEFLDSSHMKIGNKIFTAGESIQIGTDAVNRYQSQKIKEVLKICPGNICGELHQVCSYSQDGFKVWNCNKLLR